MKRVIIASPVLAPEALAELKEWLGITTAGEDATLSGLLAGALESCEAFTGIVPIECDCEEVFPVTSDWMPIAARPVHAITGVEAIPVSGPRSELPASAYGIEFAGDGAGLVRITDPGPASRIAVRFAAGLANGWSTLPEGLRQGIIRLAAHHYRQRESDNADAHPPAAVAALWRPWRQLRLT
ncbi:MAG: hypothetical protein ACKOPQ_00115 [Novosphingobium sp.]|jgi:uncharacterized phiE125 gp8 family phage protein